MVKYQYRTPSNKAPLNREQIAAGWQRIDCITCRGKPGKYQELRGRKCPLCKGVGKIVVNKF